MLPDREIKKAEKNVMSEKFARRAACILAISGAPLAILLSFASLSEFLQGIVLLGPGWVIYLGWIWKAMGRKTAGDPYGLWILSLIVHEFWGSFVFFHFDFDPTNGFFYYQIKIHVLLAILLSLAVIRSHIMEKMSSPWASRLNHPLAFLLTGLLIVSPLLLVHYYEYTRLQTAEKARILGDKIHDGIEVEQSRRELIEMIDGGNEETAGYAIYALGETKDNSQETLDCLLRALKKENPSLKRAAAIAFTEIKHQREDIIDELIKQLDSTWDVSVFSAEALGNIGKAAQKALPKLKENARSEGELKSSACKKAIELILKDLEEFKYGN